MRWLLKFIRWLLFKVSVPLAPFIVKAMLMVANKGYVELADISTKGELSLICPVLAADGAASLFFDSSKKLPFFNLVCFSFSIIILIISCFWNAAVLNDNSLNPSIVSYFSIILFALTILTNGSCKLIVEYEKAIIEYKEEYEEKNLEEKAVNDKPDSP